MSGCKLPRCNGKGDPTGCTAHYCYSEYINMTVEEAFDKAMADRQYGEQERRDAFEWFEEGWNAANSRPKVTDEKPRVDEKSKVDPITKSKEERQKEHSLYCGCRVCSGSY